MKVAIKYTIPTASAHARANTHASLDMLLSRRNVNPAVRHAVHGARVIGYKRADNWVDAEASYGIVLREEARWVGRP